MSNYPPGVTDADIDEHFEDAWRSECHFTCRWCFRDTGWQGLDRDAGVCLVDVIEEEDPALAHLVWTDEAACDRWEPR